LKDFICLHMEPNVWLSATRAPETDPTPIFELFRGNFATEILTAAVTHFRIFSRFSAGKLSMNQLRRELGLAERPSQVMVTALLSFGLLEKDSDGNLDLTPLAREHLVQGTHFDVTDYIGLAANSPGVQAMIQRLESNRPAGSNPAEAGAAFIFREGLESAMENEESARGLTLALAGRAKNVAPVLTERVDMSRADLLLDVGGGTGVYSIAFLQKNPRLRAIVWDRPEVLKVAAEMAQAHGIQDRLELRPGDMFSDAPPENADVILFSNILHDWDVAQCRGLLGRCAESMKPGGRILIHDVFLNDALDGPQAVALYSAALFSLTEGRAYSGAEYRMWLQEAGLEPGEIVPTLVHCGVLTGVKHE
jgi:precorrin-6B methylase 2